MAHLYDQFIENLLGLFVFELGTEIINDDERVHSFLSVGKTFLIDSHKNLSGVFVIQMLSIIQIFLVKIGLVLDRLERYFGDNDIYVFETLAEYAREKLEDFRRFALTHQPSEDGEVVSAK
jgi:hypothetical protein